MLSLPFTSSQSKNTHLPRCGIAVLAMLVLAGCASGPKPESRGNQDEIIAGTDGRPVEARDVPPQAQTLYEQAVASMAAGDLIAAELRLHDFLSQYPGYPGAHVNMAIIFVSRGDEKAAENSLVNALNIDPGHAVALNQFGMLLRRQGKFHEAETAYLKAVTANPDYAFAHYNLAVLNDLYLQRLDTALGHYERYQALVGEDRQVQKWIVDLKRRIGATQRTANVTE